MPRSFALAPLAALLLLGCARAASEAATFGLQHTLGVAAGPCPRAMDSVGVARGAPWRQYRSDEEDRSAGTQVFWHEWAYTLPADDGGARRDSVAVVGFRWGDGVVGCDVRERHARRPGPRGLPWEAAGQVPSGG